MGCPDNDLDIDKNCDTATAEPLSVNAPNDTTPEILEGDFDDPTADQDFYEFTAKKGQVLNFYTDAKPSPPDDPFGPDYADLVITLYDANGDQIAENDDPIPRNSNDSELITVIPADGTYYVRVEECNAWATQNGFPAGSCADAGNILDTTYRIGIFELSAADMGTIIEDPAQDFSDTMPGAAEYAPVMNMAGSYYLSVNTGFFADVNDKDYLSFMIPVDDPATMPVEGYKIAANERLMARFMPLPSGKMGNGSTAPIGSISIVDDMQNVVAKIDPSKYAEIWAPLEAGKTYHAVVEPLASGNFASNPFYVFLHGGSSSNPVEQEILSMGMTKNNDQASAEALVKAPMQNSYFVDGDLELAGVEADYFSMAVPAGTTKVSVACGGKSDGSGLEGLTATVFVTEANPLKTGSEPADDSIFLQDVAIPNGTANIFVKLSAMSQNPGVAGKYYHCGFHFTQ